MRFNLIETPARHGVQARAFFRAGQHAHEFRRGVQRVGSQEAQRASGFTPHVIVLIVVHGSDARRDDFGTAARCRERQHDQLTHVPVGGSDQT